MNIYSSIFDLVGHTPLIRLENLEKAYHLSAKIVAKAECFNPAGSAKDRVARQMLTDAVESGALKKDTVIIEPTSGNTGIGLASLAGKLGYKVILTMPETMSVERQKLLKAYGAELVLTEGAKGMTGAIAKANELAEAYPDAWIPSQFDNPSNPKAHYLTTGKEIWEDSDGTVDIFVAGVGTGGTISGTGKYLKEQNKNIKIVAVEPTNSPFLTTGKGGKHGLMGIGAGFEPKNFDRSVVDDILTVKEEEAYEIGRFVAKHEGLLVGITSGASLFASVIEAKKAENAGKTIVALLPDTGERYLSTPMFES